METKISTPIFVLIANGAMGFAQSKTEKEPAKTQQQEDSVYYACIIHPDVKLDKQGTCNKCGMLLEMKTRVASDTKNENATKIYTCSMHLGVKSDKPGKCPKCRMDLKEKNNLQW